MRDRRERRGRHLRSDDVAQRGDVREFVLRYPHSAHETKAQVALRSYRAALERALGNAFPLEDALGEVTVKDETGAYFHYELRATATSVDAHVLASMGLIAEPPEAEEVDDEDDDAEAAS